jgi:hypothetical protein
MKTFDLYKKYDFITLDVQNNLKILQKKFGNKFNIKCKSIIIPVVLYFDFCYRIYYDIENRTFDLYPFKIKFIDLATNTLNNNSYISNIHKTNTINGSLMVLIVLQLNKVLNVKKSYIYDGTSIKCKGNNFDLSYIKLLEKNITFYMKFGFEFDIKIHDSYMNFHTSIEKYNYIMNIIKKCKKIKNSNIKKLYIKILNLLNIIIKEQQYDKLKIQNKDGNNMWFKEFVYVDDLLYEAKLMLELCNNIKETYLYETIIKLFNDKNNCDKLNLINRYIIENQAFNIIYKNTTINYKLVECFRILKNLRYSLFVYNYN